MRKNRLVHILINMIILILSGCTTQGRLTYLVFEESENYIELKTSMEELKIEGYEGSNQQQFSALKEVRYISKYMDARPGDAIRRELAVSALVFLAFSGELSVSNIFLALFKIVNSGFFGSLPSLVGFMRFYCFISTWGFGSY